MAVERPSLDELMTLFRSRLNIDIPDPSLDLLEEGYLDSMLLIELMLLLETDFGITLDVENLDLDRLRSVESIGDLINVELEGT